MKLTDKQIEHARLYRIAHRGHDCAEHLYYDGGVGRCAWCEISLGELIREAVELNK